MTSVVEDEAYLTEVMGKDYALNVQCVLLYCDGEDVKLWTGSFAQSKIFEATVVHDKAILLKFAVGDSEVEYWTRKFPLIKAQWLRDGKWREWTRKSIST
jgi:hypothetical protein